MSTEVLLNGQPAGVAFMKFYRVPAAGLLRPGRNDLETRVANLWSDYIHSLPPQASTTPAADYPITNALYGPSRRIAPESGPRFPT